MTRRRLLLVTALATALLVVSALPAGGATAGPRGPSTRRPAGCARSFWGTTVLMASATRIYALTEVL
jgi:hypothetical protein